jgi:hypothetical protein
MNGELAESVAGGAHGAKRIARYFLLNICATFSIERPPK